MSLVANTIHIEKRYFRTISNFSDILRTQGSTPLDKPSVGCSGLAGVDHKPFEGVVIVFFMIPSSSLPCRDIHLALPDATSDFIYSFKFFGERLDGGDVRSTDDIFQRVCGIRRIIKRTI
jgi:hypothetical protein